jgi:hypothetical protein
MSRGGPAVASEIAWKSHILFEEGAINDRLPAFFLKAEIILSCIVGTNPSSEMTRRIGSSNPET